MRLSNLVKVVGKKAKRVGRGHGSGKGKTSSRGYKGQKSRESVKIGFEGGQLRLIKRLPFVRGVGNSSYKLKPIGVNLNALRVFESGAVVDKESLMKKGVLNPRQSKKEIKIVGTGDLDRPLIIKLPISQKALAKVEKAGGKVE